MNRQKYLAELSGLLSFLSKEDRELVMSHYNRRFDAAGPEGEAALIAELGTPMRLAISLNREGIEGISEDEERAAREKAAAVESHPPAESEPEAAETAGETATEPASEPAEPEHAPKPEPESEPTSGSEPEPVSEPEQASVPEPGPAAEAAPEPAPAEPVPETGPEVDEDEPSGEPEDSEPDGQARFPEPEQLPESDAPAPEKSPHEARAEQLLRAMTDPTSTESFPELDFVRGRSASEPAGPEVRTSVPGAVLFGVLCVVPGIPLLALTILLIPALLLPGGTLCWLSTFGFAAGAATTAYFADAMFVFGAAFLTVGCGALLLVLGLYIDFVLISAWIRGLPALFRRLARKGGAK